MKTLNIDIETYSGVDLAKSGVYRYVDGDDFEVMPFAYSVDSGPVQVIHLETVSLSRLKLNKRYLMKI
ncbi:hypothetical protein [Paracerasibacillus soli]|uniref:Uncharacterized protein n=1 Tax=Paracerasibacillus soli TaxID=480284 RepID=A0ABU5CW59_9BACI|nr:hypothetical protein [Virgibacillus soli]MDY0410616.1 hypothetical protein [Virgibacillus soli]